MNSSPWLLALRGTAEGEGEEIAAEEERRGSLLFDGAKELCVALLAAVKVGGEETADHRARTFHERCRAPAGSSRARGDCGSRERAAGPAAAAGAAILPDRQHRGNRRGSLRLGASPRGKMLRSSGAAAGSGGRGERDVHELGIATEIYESCRSAVDREGAGRLYR